MYEILDIRVPKLAFLVYGTYLGVSDSKKSAAVALLLLEALFTRD